MCKLLKTDLVTNYKYKIYQWKLYIKANYSLFLVSFKIITRIVINVLYKQEISYGRDNSEECYM